MYYDILRAVIILIFSSILYNFENHNTTLLSLLLGTLCNFGLAHYFYLQNRFRVYGLHMIIGNLLFFGYIIFTLRDIEGGKQIILHVGENVCPLNNESYVTSV